jgi:hypothetical protein
VSRQLPISAACIRARGYWKPILLLLLPLLLRGAVQNDQAYGAGQITVLKVGSGLSDRMYIGSTGPNGHHFVWEVVTTASTRRWRGTQPL